MSAANPEWGPEPSSASEEPMPRGIALSAALHLVVALLVVFGLPTLFRARMEENPPIAVRLVTIAPETRATEPNPDRPHRHAAPVEAIPGPPAPKPLPKPAAPTPPPSAAAPPPLPPEPKPSVETPVKEAPPPLPPKPKPPAEALAKEIPPPLPPEPKPAPQAPAKEASPPPAAVPKPPPPEPKPPQALANEAPPPLPRSKPVPAPPKRLAAMVPPLPKMKPAPPHKRAKAEPRRERMKYTEAGFEHLLKNLAIDATGPSEETPPRRDRTPSGRASSQPKAPRGAQLTASEIDLIREQIERCWDVPAGARDAKNLVVEIEVSLNPDGTVRQARIVDTARMASDPYFRAAAESARRALFNPLCTPLRLPPDKYPIWREMVLNFDPKDIL
jgi:hypothetical protein